VLTTDNAAALGFATPAPQQLGRPVFGAERIDPRYDAVWQIEDTACSRYHGLTVSLGRKLTRQFGLQVSYTLSRCRISAKHSMPPARGVCSFRSSSNLREAVSVARP
jgi:hypothetical protein